jgi:hypothetical protein
VRIVAVSTEVISPLAWAGKVSHPLSMNTCPPVFILRAMTFAAETVALCEVYELPIIESQFIPILCIVAVETPSHRFGVMELDIGVFFFQFSLLSIHFHGRMAVAAGKHSLGHRRRSIFFNDRRGSGSEKKQQKQ